MPAESGLHVDHDHESDSTEHRVQQETQRLDARFACNICLEAVNEPVVTGCGHLYCWPCLYQWLEPGMLASERAGLLGYHSGSATYDATKRVCPVCKAPCSVQRVVPIYVRERSSTSIRSGKACTDQCEVDDTGTLPVMPTESTSTGLRQRLRFRSTDSEIPSVPRRPVADPLISSPTNTTVVQSSSRIPLSPTAHPSLSHGMLPLVQQYARSVVPAVVPPLHRLEHVNDNDATADYQTEFLSRLLLLLGSFVLLCLLLF